MFRSLFRIVYLSFTSGKMIRLLLIITSIFFTACVSRAPQKTITRKKTRMTCFERLDTADANKRILEYRKKEEQESPGDQFLSPPRYCKYTDSMGCTISVTKATVGYVTRKLRHESLFGEYRFYFPNGNIQESGEYFVKEFDCGIWREYDIEGNLIKETDMDRPYRKYSWQNILLFIKEHNIDLYDEQTFVDRYVDELNVPYWYISWRDKEKKVFRGITIDARNGQITADDVLQRVECLTDY